MPVAKIYVHEDSFTNERLEKIGLAVQAALEETLQIPADDYFRMFHVLPKERFVHTPGFLGLIYSKEFILLEVTFIVSRPPEVRLALLRCLNEKIVEAVGISPDDLVITIYEIAGENISFGRGQAQRAHISSGTTNH
ncbi:hypothetical protein C7H84_35560 [Burkholderia sp. Nafp2/4-1b]|uniref:tautomerase family protein n=1 Tax=Burkholderia sp. Nafp2/4-1b TaxID=2116686 RepID=UPI000EF93847|nr:tautomerase family protein [Burkholderia sp. Nafp2/4-1b]RKT98716.1 hypothetical protein C7H84_35560 [Burkholderia sp. Nafp2/4-1b]